MVLYQYSKDLYYWWFRKIINCHVSPLNKDMYIACRLLNDNISITFIPSQLVFCVTGFAVLEGNPFLVLAYVIIYLIQKCLLLHWSCSELEVFEFSSNLYEYNVQPLYPCFIRSFNFFRNKYVENKAINVSYWFSKMRHDYVYMAIVITLDVYGRKVNFVSLDMFKVPKT